MLRDRAGSSPIVVVPPLKHGPDDRAGVMSLGLENILN